MQLVKRASREPGVLGIGGYDLDAAQASPRDELRSHRDVRGVRVQANDAPTRGDPLDQELDDTARTQSYREAGDPRGDAE